jgi:hypothetical protein
MKLICPCHGHEIVLKQPYQYHAGFNDRGVLYCDTSSGTLTFSSYNPDYLKLVGEKHPWTLSKREKQKVENHLMACSCGGRYSFSAPPRCPFCNCNLASLLIDEMHYIEIGDVVDADKKSVWLCRPMPG